MIFLCERCNRTEPYGAWVTARWKDANTVHRCRYCGSSHSVRKGRLASVITPPLAGIASPVGVLSPWIDSRYHPYVHGVFECEFRDGLRLRLMWDGRAWTWTGQQVDTSTMVKWRGKHDCR